MEQNKNLTEENKGTLGAIKVTLKQLIEKKLEKDGKKTATKDIYIKSLDGCITFNNPTDSARIEYSEKTKNGSYVDMVDGMIKLIYDCCPMLHSKELQESIDVDYPYDTVKAIFDIDEIMDIGVKLMNFFDDEEDGSEEKLKN
ncbi:MAG: hypothetical protein Q4P35_03965 [Clostridia bacterium]|nr:hypothetical protein [Clostridia bacterium]